MSVCRVRSAVFTTTRINNIHKTVLEKTPSIENGMNFFVDLIYIRFILSNSLVSFVRVI